jgi:hypothetical protein
MATTHYLINKKIKNHKPHHTQTDTCFPPIPHKHSQYHIRSTHTQQQNKVSKLTISKNQVNKHSNFKIYFKSNTYPVTQREREKERMKEIWWQWSGRQTTRSKRQWWRAENVSNLGFHFFFFFFF